MNTELVYDWMSRDVIMVTPNTRVLDAHKMLLEYDVRRLPVISHDGNLVGIVTRKDIRSVIGAGVALPKDWSFNRSLATLKVRAMMTTNPITVSVTDVVANAAKLMIDHKLSGLPVVAPVDNVLVGIITRTDILRMITARPEFEGNVEKVVPLNGQQALN